MSGIYYKAPNDGAGFRCKSCDVVKHYTRCIVHRHTETAKNTIFCLDCVDSDWLRDANCLGTFKMYGD